MIRIKILNTILIFFSLFIILACGGEDKGVSGSLSGSANGQTSTTGYVDSSGYPAGMSALDTGATTVADLANNPDTLDALNEMVGAPSAQQFLDALNSLDAATSVSQVGSDLGKILPILAMMIQDSSKQLQDEYTALIKALVAELVQLRKNPTAANVKKFAKKHRGRICGLAKRAAKEHNESKSK